VEFRKRRGRITASPIKKKNEIALKRKRVPLPLDLNASVGGGGGVKRCSSLVQGVIDWYSRIGALRSIETSQIENMITAPTQSCFYFTRLSFFCRQLPI